jgi:hypothetical protein
MVLTLDPAHSHTTVHSLQTVRSQGFGVARSEHPVLSRMTARSLSSVLAIAPARSTARSLTAALSSSIGSLIRGRCSPHQRLALALLGAHGSNGSLSGLRYSPLTRLAPGAGRSQRQRLAPHHRRSRVSRLAPRSLGALAAPGSLVPFGTRQGRRLAHRPGCSLGERLAHTRRCYRYTRLAQPASGTLRVHGSLIHPGTVEVNG